MRRAMVDAGDASLPVSIPTDVPTGPLSLELVLPDRATATVPLIVRAPPRLLLVAGIRRRRERSSGRSPPSISTSPSPAPGHPPLLDAFDLVVLADTPTDGPGLASRLVRRYARPVGPRRGGLVAIGGEHAYDLGGWRTSPLADWLPVEIEPAGPQQQGAVSLVLAIDKSGSMAIGGGDDSRLDRRRPDHRRTSRGLEDPARDRRDGRGD